MGGWMEVGRDWWMEKMKTISYKFYMTITHMHTIQKVLCTHLYDLLYMMCFVHASCTLLRAVVSLKYLSLVNCQSIKILQHPKLPHHNSWGGWGNNSQRLRGCSLIQPHETKKDRVHQELKGKSGVCTSTSATVSEKTPTCSGVKG